ncbi:hypothetical protein GN244_ATG16078 [Phytophthora infestans]|uniref:Uncharacterized protein n=1 Tax=Phytophthora infestans TaxID=4787 RepID=A0A833WFG4_PHYIN|nr:hypothetical protein GN244_ATG16078 [Phytophthora infestans]
MQRHPVSNCASYRPRRGDTHAGNEKSRVEYTEDNRQYTLAQKCGMLHRRKRQHISHLVKQRYLHGLTRVELESCDKETNIDKRSGFVLGYITTKPITIYIVKGLKDVSEMRCGKLASLKGANLQLQCAILPEVGLIHCYTPGKH